MNESLRVKTTVNLSYSLFSKLFTFSLASVTAIVFARKLSPNDYGIVGFAMIFIDFLGKFSDLVSRPTLSKRKVSGRATFILPSRSRFICAPFIFLSFIWGSVSQRVFDNPAVRAVIIVPGCWLLDRLHWVSSNDKLARDLRFKRLTVPQIGSQVTATAVAMAAVYWGSGTGASFSQTLADGIATAAKTPSTRSSGPIETASGTRRPRRST